jgi:hypothetical protein
MTTAPNSSLGVEAFPTGMLPRVASSGCRARIKAPFSITTMKDDRFGTLLWVWARRGRHWIVSQELRLAAANNRNERVQKDPFRWKTKVA